MRDHGWTRRQTLKRGAGAAALLGATSPSETLGQTTERREEGSPLRLTVNAEPHELFVDNRRSLLELLREDLGLTGTKRGCDQGQCGACTVIVDGRRLYSCLTFAIMFEGARVTTIEGLSIGGKLHPMQTAFVRHDAFQCGFCTPGQICSAIGMLDEVEAGWPSYRAENVADPPVLTRNEVRERMSGNLCRCGAYPNIVDAVLAAGRSST